MSPVSAKTLEVLDNLDSPNEGSSGLLEVPSEPRRQPPSSGIFAKDQYHAPLELGRLPANPVPTFEDLPSLDDDVPFATPPVAQNDSARIDFESVLVRVSTVPPPVSLAALEVPSAPAPSLGETTGALEQLVARPASSSGSFGRRAALLGVVLALSGGAVAAAAYTFGPSPAAEPAPTSAAIPVEATSAEVPPAFAPAAQAPAAVAEETMVFGMEDLAGGAPALATPTTVRPSAAPSSEAAVATTTPAATSASTDVAVPTAAAVATTGSEGAVPTAVEPAAVDGSAVVAAEGTVPVEQVAPAPPPTAEERMNSLLTSAVTSTNGDAIHSLAPERQANGSQGLPAQPARTEVVAAMRGVGSGVDACTSTTGSVLLRITFASDGSVRSASPAAPFAGTSEGACMAQAVQGAHVSPFARPSFTVSYPFTLR